MGSFWNPLCRNTRALLVMDPYRFYASIFPNVVLLSTLTMFRMIAMISSLVWLSQSILVTGLPLETKQTNKAEQSGSVIPFFNGRPVSDARLHFYRPPLPLLHPGNPMLPHRHILTTLNTVLPFRTPYTVSSFFLKFPFSVTLSIFNFILLDPVQISILFLHSHLQVSRQR